MHNNHWADTQGGYNIFWIEWKALTSSVLEDVDSFQVKKIRFDPERPTQILITDVKKINLEEL